MEQKKVYNINFPTDRSFKERFWNKVRYQSSWQSTIHGILQVHPYSVCWKQTQFEQIKSSFYHSVMVQGALGDFYHPQS